ncbi:hypothetical protein AABM17_250 [Neisseria musculi]|uniref:Uncharacterized protein n=1 Tax=Neisseria musculi TaxID=1815583 RepID=A0A7H1MDD8_9NEIS|nr:hypothetical protein H7A79_0250 [Neisseria musculi]
MTSIQPTVCLLMFIGRLFFISERQNDEKNNIGFGGCNTCCCLLKQTAATLRGCVSD